MTGEPQYAEHDPRHHTAKLKALLAQAARHARDDVGKISDARAQALFETTAEVLGGLEAAYDHYEKRSRGLREPRRDTSECGLDSLRPASP